MITDNTLGLVLPTYQGKHLPQCRLQGTKRDRAWLVYPIGLTCPRGGFVVGLAVYTPRPL